MQITHPHYQARYRAYEAIDHEVLRRNIETQEKQRRQARRKTHISKAAALVSEASELCVFAANAESAAPYSQAPIAPPDVAAMDDDELASTLSSYRAELVQIGTIHETKSEQSTLIALLKTPEAKTISRELKADADAYAKRCESLSVAVDAVSAEIERRGAERAAAKAVREETAANLPGIVADLSERLAKLEQGE